MASHGLYLHGLRVAVHVHQTDAASGVSRHDLLRAGLTQSPNVIDDVNAPV